jgi:hypothetical protein
VLAGRNWAAEAEGAFEGKGEATGEATGEAKRLDQLPLQDVLEKADHVIDVRLHVLTCTLGNRLHAGACRCPCLPVRGGLGCGLKIGTCGWTEQELSNVFPKLASHKFCNSLMARHHKVRTSAPLSLHHSRCTTLAAPLSLHHSRCLPIPRPSFLVPPPSRPLPRTQHPCCHGVVSRVRAAVGELWARAKATTRPVTLTVASPPPQYVRRKARGLSGAQISRCNLPAGCYSECLTCVSSSSVFLSEGLG